MSWLTHNLGLKIGALLLASLLWGMAAYADNPTETTDFTVAVTPVGLAKGLGVVQGLTPVTVTIAGVKQNMDQLRRQPGGVSRIIQASVDLSHAGPGETTVPVSVRLLVASVSIRNFAPASLALHLDPIDMHSAAVSVVLSGAPNGDYIAQGSPVVNPASVTLVGPRSVVDAATPTVSVDLGNSSTTIDQIFRVGIVGRDGRFVQLPADGVTSQPPQVEVQVPIERRVIEKTVALEAQITGTPAGGYFVCGVSQSDLVATVSGAPAALQGLESLELPPVDIGGQQSSVDETLDPILPAGVTLSTPQHVRLHVCIDRSQVVASPAPSPSPSPSPSPPAATPSP